MSKLTALVTNAAARCDPPTDTALAHAIGVSKSAVSLWRKGGKVSTLHLARLIERAEADPALATEILEEQAQDRHERNVWATVARRLGAAATVAAVALLFRDHTPALIEAATLTPVLTMHYANWTIALTLIAAAVWSRRGRSATPVLA